MKTLPFVGDSFCMCCGKALSDPQREYCGDCLQRERAFDGGRGMLIHRESAQQAIYRFKFHGQRVYADDFVALLYQCFARQIRVWEPDLIVPIPLHPSRRRERGYDQCELLAERLSQISSIPWSARALIRTRKTKKQKELEPGRRRGNVAGAFGVGEFSPDVRCVLLIDDIFTTGATIDEAAHTLKLHGVKRVYFLTLSIGQED